MNQQKTCVNCIWYEQCGQDAACEDHSPVDDAGACFTYYEDVLAENHAEYMQWVAELEDTDE